MRLLLAVAVLFTLLLLWPQDKERVETRRRYYPSGQLKEDAEALVIPGEEPMYHGCYSPLFRRRPAALDGPLQEWKNGRSVAFLG